VTKLALNHHAEARGHDLVVDALERANGARDLASVLEPRIVNALTS
jgi:hypothetical protein